MKEDWFEDDIGSITQKTFYIKWSEAPDIELKYIDLTSVSRETQSIENSTLINQQNAPSRAKKIVSTGDVIFGTTRPTLRRLAIVSDEYNNQICSTGFSVLRPKREVDSKFLFYFLQTEGFYDRMESLQRGTSYPAVTDKDVKSCKIPIPPLPEQKQIVSILDKAFAAIDQAKANIERNIENAKELFQSKLNEVFIQKGEGWDERRLDSIAEIINGYSFSSRDFSSKNEVKSIKITNVGIKEFVEDESNNLPSKFLDEFSRVIIGEGNIVFALTRTIISGGLKVAKVPKSYNNSLLNQRVAAVVPNEEVIDKEYLYQYFNSQIVYNYVLDNVNTLMQPNLSINDLKALIVPFPNKKDQEIISSLIFELQKKSSELILKYESEVACLEELKNSLLQEAFDGELTKYFKVQEEIAMAAEPNSDYNN